MKAWLTIRYLETELDEMWSREFENNISAYQSSKKHRDETVKFTNPISSNVTVSTFKKDNFMETEPTYYSRELHQSKWDFSLKFLRSHNLGLGLTWCKTMRSILTTTTTTLAINFRIRAGSKIANVNEWSEHDCNPIIISELYCYLLHVNYLYFSVHFSIKVSYIWNAETRRDGWGFELTHNLIHVLLLLARIIPCG